MPAKNHRKSNGAVSRSKPLLASDGGLKKDKRLSPLYFETFPYERHLERSRSCWASRSSEKRAQDRERFRYNIKRWRESLSPEKKEEIRKKDRERKRRQRHPELYPVEELPQETVSLKEHEAQILDLKRRREVSKNSTRKHRLNKISRKRK